MNGAYFDNAATSYPKPESVYRELIHTLREMGGNPGRAGHRLSTLAAKKVYSCREEVARFVGSNDPERVVFFLNATSALNAAIKGFAREGMHILISSIEHNSVLRPVHSLLRQGVSYSFFEASRDSGKLVFNIERSRQKNTAIVVMNHRSNLFPMTLDAQAVGRYCRQKGLIFILDASQSAGCTDIDVNAFGTHALCLAGHKSLYGIQGVGVCVFGSDVDVSRVNVQNEGGSGINSVERIMPNVSPERFEAGTLPLGAIASLGEGIRFVSSVGIKEIERKENALGARALEILGNTEGIEIVRPELGAGSVISFKHKSIGCEELADRLDRAGIFCRAGLHCTPCAHESAGTLDSGAVRLSFGYFNNMKQLDHFAKELSYALKI